MPAALGRAAALLVAASLCAAPASAADVGQVKVARGDVRVERDGRPQPAAVGQRLSERDVVKTGADGSVGITLDDDSLLSAGPNSTLALERYAFDPTTGRGRFEARLDRGTLAVASGRLAKQSPDAMTVRTPTAVLGVRGTTFAVSADE